MSDDGDGGGDGAGISAVQLATLMETIKSSSDRMEAQFSQFKDKVKRSQEETATKAVKRAQHEKPYTRE